MRHHRFVTAGIAASAGLLGALSWATPAHADGPDLGGAVCPTVANAGSGLASAASGAAGAASGITGKTAPPPEMAEFFTKMALTGACPATVAQLSTGRLPDVPFILNDAPGSTGLFEGGLLPGGIPGMGG